MSKLTERFSNAKKFLRYIVLYGPKRTLAKAGYRSKPGKLSWVLLKLAFSRFGQRSETRIIIVGLGGGRFIGEGCHFLDLICYLENDYGPKISLSYGQKTNNDYSHWTALLEFKSGATGVVNYITHGSTSLPKERLEVNWEDHSILMNNFRETKFYGRKVTTFKTKIQDKGQGEY
ncbi:MAG: hypothetical protein L7V15_03800, partial [Burkholderiales bacterium]|nr:hypothetical protein [Burkholderiales bacterium]